jgi:hypothetical protein
MAKFFPTGSDEKFNQFLVREYLKYGSVDGVFKKFEYDLPISYAGFQRVLDRWGLVKSAGPNNKLSEIIDFFEKMAKEKLPLEGIYKKMPLSFKTSAVTLYRILSYIKEGVTRRLATAIIFTCKGREKEILVAQDFSNPKREYGKVRGVLTIPISFTNQKDPRERALLRVLQHEVFVQKALDKKIPGVIPNNPKPIIFLDIADVRVEIFHIVLPKKFSEISNFSSFKLKNFQFVSLSKLKREKSEKLIPGYREVAFAFEKYINNKTKLKKPLIVRANLNEVLKNY